MNKCSFIGFGELLIDEIYDSNNNLIKKDGGDSNMNVIHNLALMGEKCYAVGTVGDDENTEIAISSLSRVGVNTEHIKKINKPTNVVYQYMPEEITTDNSVKFSCIHPGTDIPSWVVSAEDLTMQIPPSLQDKNIILVLHNMEPACVEFMESIKNRRVALDIGLVSSISHLDRQYIQDFLNNVNICQINNNVLEVLLRKLGLTNLRELYESFNFDLMTLTQGKSGATFLYADALGETHQVEKRPLTFVKPRDPSGAGDAFFSVFLKIYNKYISQDKSVDFNFVDNGFNLANLFSATMVKEMGGRGNDSNVISRWLEQVKEFELADELVR